MIQLYNSLTRKKESLKPIQEGRVGLYVCGITVYDYCHIGHARSMVTFDILVRFLRAQGYEVNYVRNITDIDDKIIKRAHEKGVSPKHLAEQFIKEMRDDFATLDILPPDREPRATKFIQQMIAMIGALVAKDYAYVAENGDVCYRVKNFADYGKLSHRDIEGMRAGARVDIVEAKEDPLDFVLWKIAKPDEPSWPSPWGEGRPGWHIECSAMSTFCLGDNFDIHGGGYDLQFPHHENEIAQAEAATEKPFANLWLHVGFVQVDQEKMSKSLGNFFTIREVLDKYSAEAVRYFMIASHYRSPVNYSQESLNLAQAALQRLYTALRGLPAAEPVVDSEFSKRFFAAMADDLNTPVALSVIFDMAHAINRLRAEGNEAQAASLAALMLKLAGSLGILQQDPEGVLQGDLAEDVAGHVEAMIKQRDQARANKDWQTADDIRDRLMAMGIVLEDSAQGTKWRQTRDQELQSRD